MSTASTTSVASPEYEAVVCFSLEKYDLIETWSVYEFQEMVGFDCIKLDVVIKWLFQWGTGTFILSMKLSFTQFPFCYWLIQFVYIAFP